MQRCAICQQIDPEAARHHDRRAAFENAMVIVSVLGGSTNAVLHLIAMARSVGLNLTLQDFQNRVSNKTPFLADFRQPSGKYVMEDPAWRWAELLARDQDADRSGHVRWQLHDSDGQNSRRKREGSAGAEGRPGMCASRYRSAAEGDRLASHPDIAAWHAWRPKARWRRLHRQGRAAVLVGPAKVYDSEELMCWHRSNAARSKRARCW